MGNVHCTVFTRKMAKNYEPVPSSLTFVKFSLNGCNKSCCYFFKYSMFMENLKFKSSRKGYCHNIFEI
jgi:hypothetical protein